MARLLRRQVSIAQSFIHAFLGFQVALFCSIVPAFLFLFPQLLVTFPSFILPFLSLLLNPLATLSYYLPFSISYHFFIPSFPFVPFHCFSPTISSHSSFIFLLPIMWLISFPFLSFPIFPSFLCMYIFTFLSLPSFCFTFPSSPFFYIFFSLSFPRNVSLSLSVPFPLFLSSSPLFPP